MRFVIPFLGFWLFLMAQIVYCRIAAVHLQTLHFLPLFFLLVGIFGTATLAFGAKETGSSLTAFRYLFAKAKAPFDTRKKIVVINFMIVSCFAQGGLLFLIEILSLVKHFQVLTSTPTKLGFIFHYMACILFAALFISEALLRPLKARLETLDWE